MYKRAVISDEISQDLVAAVAMARDFRLEAVELRNVWGRRIDLLDDEEMRRARDIVREAGLRVAAIASPFLKANIDDDAEYREHLEILRRSIRAAKLFGTNLIRCFTFWKDRQLDQAYSRILAQYAEPIRVAAGEGVVLGVENEASTFIATGEQLARFLADLSSPVVKATWDPGNAYFDELHERAYPVGYEAVKSQIVHVHIKDCARNPSTGKLEWVPLGKGEVDVRGQLRALVADGYDGFVSLETHYRPRQLPEEVLRSPSGQVFSEMGARATAECLRNWDEMLGR